MKNIRHRETQWPYHLMLLPGVIIILIYAYFPMFGLVMVFQNFNPVKGFFDSAWVGFENFSYAFLLPDFWRVMYNTVFIAICKIILSILVPLILALMVNEIMTGWFKKLVQTSIFLPYFLSWAILGGIVSEFFSLGGPINGIIKMAGGRAISFLSSNFWFPQLIILTDIWKGMGYNMIIFLAAITAIDPTIYEAVEIDGGGRWHKMFNITLPSMAPTIILITTLSLGNLLNAGFEQILILYNPIVYQSGDIVDTLVYRMGIFNQQYSVSAAIGLFKSVITFTLIAVSYRIAYITTDYHLF